MIKSSRTPIGIYLNLCKQYGITPDVPTYTTLNEKFNVLPGVIPNDLDDLETKYIAIGNGGLVTGDASDDNAIAITPARRKPQALSLYNHIPFIMRPLDEPLNQVERRKYRMEVVETYNGVQYQVFYLKTLDQIATKPTMELITYDESGRTSTAYVPSQEALFPTHPANTPVQDGIREVLSVQLKISFELNETDVAEIINAIGIIYGRAGYGMISEIGLISGADEERDVMIGLDTVTVKESIATQLVGSLTTGRLIELGEVTGTTEILVGGTDALVP